MLEGWTLAQPTPAATGSAPSWLACVLKFAKCWFRTFSGSGGIAKCGRSTWNTCITKYVCMCMCACIREGNNNSFQRNLGNGSTWLVVLHALSLRAMTAIPTPPSSTVCLGQCMFSVLHSHCMAQTSHSPGWHIWGTGGAGSCSWMTSLINQAPKFRHGLISHCSPVHTNWPELTQD